MCSTKIRRKIIFALAASACIGVAPVAPAVSQARRPIIVYSNNANGEQCEARQNWYDFYRSETTRAIENFDYAGAFSAAENAAEEKVEAGLEGCDTSTWATIPPTRPKTNQVGSSTPPVLAP